MRLKEILDVIPKNEEIVICLNDAHGDPIYGWLIDPESDRDRLKPVLDKTVTCIRSDEASLCSGVKTSIIIDIED